MSKFEDGITYPNFRASALPQLTDANFRVSNRYLPHDHSFIGGGASFGCRTKLKVGG